MKTIQFKTNIKCEGCVATVTPFLDHEEGVEDWKVDTDNPDKVLTVTGEELDPQRVKNVVKQAGFQAEVIRVSGIGGNDI